jgi:hypothetical protein
VTSLANALQYINIAAFAVLALVCLRLWRQQRGAAAFWAFATFGLLAIVAITGQVVDAVGDEHLWVTKAIIALVVFFPYFLYRFAAAFRPPARWIELSAAGATAALAVWSLALPDVPDEGEPRSGAFTAFIVALLLQWTLLSLFVAVRLWRAGRGQPTVVRHRMQLLAVGTVALGVVLVLAALASANPSSEFEVAQGLLTLASMFLFFFGFAPPKALRKVWREPEEEILRGSVDELLVAAEPNDVMRIVLPQMANIVGARGVALLDAEDRVLGAHGVDAEEVSGPGGQRFDLGQGAVIAWTNPLRSSPMRSSTCCAPSAASLCWPTSVSRRSPGSGKRSKRPTS